ALEGWLTDTRTRFPELSVGPAENLHLTLAFLGELDDAAVGAAGDAVKGAAPALGDSWRLTWGAPGVFPDWGRPRVVWLGVDAGVQRLVEVHGALAGELRARGLPAEERPYRPHLTLGRVRGRLAKERAAELRDWLATVPQVPALEADSLVLYQSLLGRPAARHVEVLRAPA
ncbi:MAG: 2,3-cyclic 3-phosphodiesterase, partial [Chloroflexota bacterium]|nr:2,3-cyclic 3-phosphodiesterase [Chloroflexota bacterium]